MKIVNGQYDKACEMLSSSALSQWSASTLQEQYEEMIEYFEGAKVKVITGWQEIGDVELDNGVLIYVPLESEEGGEAVTTVINDAGEVNEVEFGRP